MIKDVNTFFWKLPLMVFIRPSVRVDVDIAVLTSITQDHLDYHGTMDAIEGKIKVIYSRFFKKAVINKDDKYATNLLRKLSTSIEVITYSCKHPADVRLLSANFSPRNFFKRFVFWI